MRALTFDVSKPSNSPWQVQLRDIETEGGITSADAVELDFDRSISVVRTSTDVQKVIVWSASPSGSITRKASYTLGACVEVAAAPIGTDLVATGCVEPTSNAVRMRLYEVSAAENSIVLKDQGPPTGAATDIALAPAGPDMVIAVTRTVSGNLSLTAWKLVQSFPVFWP